MKNRLIALPLSFFCAMTMLPHGASAGVSTDEAAKLKTTLTPMGAEKAGNSDGTIPAWTGGMVDPKYNNPPGRRDDLFKEDKPLFSITAANLNQYADKLTEGTLAMFKKYPDTYRVDVYKTERTAAATQWVYDNTYQNALNGKLVKGNAGLYPRGVYGGVPFPIPKEGAEAIWNHLLAWRSPAWRFNFHGWLVTADGKRVLTVKCGVCDEQMPYYYPGGSVESFEKGDGFWDLGILINEGPPIRAGEGLILNQNMAAENNAAWVYLTGQRRTRKLPNGCCDTPAPPTAGVMSLDEVYVFYGRIDRFDWTLAGKREMYIPYNANQFMAGSDESVFAAHHLNPDKVRWELHRVWIVDAKLAPGQRHMASKSRYYIDEDSWNAVLGERWDANGGLWKALFSAPFAAPDIPAQVDQTFGFYDLISSAWFENTLYNEQAVQFPMMPIQPASHYTPEELAATGIR